MRRLSPSDHRSDTLACVHSISKPGRFSGRVTPPNLAYSRKSSRSPHDPAYRHARHGDEIFLDWSKRDESLSIDSNRLTATVARPSCSLREHTIDLHNCEGTCGFRRATIDDRVTGYARVCRALPSDDELGRGPGSIDEDWYHTTVIVVVVVYLDRPGSTLEPRRGAYGERLAVCSSFHTASNPECSRALERGWKWVREGVRKRERERTREREREYARGELHPLPSRQNPLARTLPATNP